MGPLPLHTMKWRQQWSHFFQCMVDLLNSRAFQRYMVHYNQPSSSKVKGYGVQVIPPYPQEC